MVLGTPQGLFFRDTRFLCRCELRVNGSQPEPLAASSPDPFSAVFVSRTRPRPGRADSTLLVFRSRYIGRGMREDIEVRNFAEEPAYCSLELLLGADFAGVFDVKEGRFQPPEGEDSIEHVAGSIVFGYRRGQVRRGSRISFSERAHTAGDTASFEIIVPAKGSWTVCYQLTPSIDDEEIEPRYQCGHPVERATPFERLTRWRRQIPAVETDHEGLRSAIVQSSEDLGALRLFDPEHPDRAVIAAGAP
jgi:glycogen debranching enzyme